MSKADVQTGYEKLEGQSMEEFCEENDLTLDEAMNATLTLGDSQVTASGITAIASKDILKHLKEWLVAEQLFKINKEIYGNKTGNTVTLRKRPRVDSAQDISEGADMNATHQATVDERTADGDSGDSGDWGTLDVKPVKFGHAQTVYENYVDSMDIDAIKQTKEDLIDGIARKADAKIWDVVFNVSSVVTDEAVADGDGSGTKFGLDYGVPHENFGAQLGDTTRAAGYRGRGIYSVTNVKLATVAQALGTAVTIDYYNGVILFATAPGSGSSYPVTCTYYYIDQPLANYVRVTTAGSIVASDMGAAKRKITVAKGVAKLFVSHPDDMGALEDEYDEAHKYGSREVLLNGEVGKLRGMKILQSHTFPEGIQLAVHPGHDFGSVVKKYDLKFRAIETEKGAGDYLLKGWRKEKAGIINKALMTFVLNSGEYATNV